MGHDLKYNICKEKKMIASIILLHDITRKKNISHKSFFGWPKLYLTCNEVNKKCPSILIKQNESQLASTFLGDD